MRKLVNSDFARLLYAERLIPVTRLLDLNDIAELFADVEPALIDGFFAGGLALDHDPVAFCSYPYEWCPEMLFSAGELTLTLQLRALAAGLTLKDATPFNVLFRGPEPVFVDFLSFVPRAPHVYTWDAYAQFVQTFLFPLLLFKRQASPISEIFLAHRDGLAPADVYNRLSRLDRFMPPALQFALLPTYLSRLKERETKDAKHSTTDSDPDRAIFIARRIILNLRHSFLKLTPSASKKSVWTEYSETMSYNNESFSTKEAFVRSALEEIAPQTVLDVGCNTGHFSCLAAKFGASVVAVDSDQSAISRLWLHSRKAKLPICTLVMDFSHPSAGLGWSNSETMSFIDRARGHFDMVLLLAVVHHLAISDGVPFSEIFKVCAEMVVRGIVVEFVPTEDPMCRKLCRNKEHLIPQLAPAAFETAYAPYFYLVRRIRLPGSFRSLYFLRKRA